MAKISKETVYKWVRVSGLLTLIPVVLCVGPMAGYVAGDWLVSEFKLPAWTSIACAVLGFMGAALETVRIIKAALLSTKE